MDGCLVMISGKGVRLCRFVGENDIDLGIIGITVEFGVSSIPIISRCEDMITAVNAQPVHNMTHPQLMNLMLSSGCEIVLKVSK